MTNAETSEKVLEGYTMGIPNCNVEVQKVMAKCWEMAPEGRPSFGDILATFQVENESESVDSQEEDEFDKAAYIISV